jgi:hypothetical protein
LSCKWLASVFSAEVVVVALNSADHDAFAIGWVTSIKRAFVSIVALLWLIYAVPVRGKAVVSSARVLVVAVLGRVKTGTRYWVTYVNGARVVVIALRLCMGTATEWVTDVFCARIAIITVRLDPSAFPCPLVAEVVSAKVLVRTILLNMPAFPCAHVARI